MKKNRSLLKKVSILDFLKKNYIFIQMGQGDSSSTPCDPNILIIYVPNKASVINSRPKKKGLPSEGMLEYDPGKFYPNTLRF